MNGREGLGSRWRVSELNEKEQREEAWATASRRGRRFRAQAGQTGCQRRRRRLEEGAGAGSQDVAPGLRATGGLAPQGGPGSDHSLPSPGHVFPEFKESDAMFAAERVSRVVGS